METEAQGLAPEPLVRRHFKASVAHERFLFLGVGPKERLAHLDNAMAASEMFSHSEKDAAGLIAQVWSEVRERKVHFEAFGASARAMDQAASAFRHIYDISSSTLWAKLP